MKINAINNNYNLSHKAYFKPNTEFKKLWAYRPDCKSDYFNKIEKFKSKLPNHELEIIKSGRAIIDEKIRDFYLIFNNETNKALGVTIAVDSAKNHFVEVLDSLLANTHRTIDFFEQNVDTTDFKTLTTKRKI